MKMKREAYSICHENINYALCNMHRLKVKNLFWFPEIFWYCVKLSEDLRQKTAGYTYTSNKDHELFQNLIVANYFRHNFGRDFYCSSWLLHLLKKSCLYISPDLFRLSRISRILELNLYFSNFITFREVNETRKDLWSIILYMCWFACILNEYLNI